MEPVLYLLLVSFGALLMVYIFQLCIYIQQNDKAFLYYSLYLLVMVVYTAIRILDTRLTYIFPLSYHVVETLDPILSNTGFLMYVNFLGVILNITKAEKFYYTNWKFLQIFIVSVLTAYIIFQVFKLNAGVSDVLITVCTLTIVSYGTILAFRLLRFINQTFFKLIIIGTVIAVIGVLSGFLVNIFIVKDKLAFAGLYFLMPAMMIEAMFLSAALGYRLKLAYKEKNQAQEKLIQETKRNEQLALRTSSLLQKELNLQNFQKRISQDLHDEVGSALSGIALYSYLTKSQIKNNETDKVNYSLEVIQNSATNMVTKLNDIVWTINPRNDSLPELLQRLEDYAKEMATVKNICFTVTGLEVMSEVKLPMNHRKNIYLILKEGINNAIKYSKCTGIVLKAYKQNNQIHLELSDNGSGFNVEKQKKGNGLINMQQRSIEINAEYSLLTSDKGTCIRLNFKIPQ